MGLIGALIVTGIDLQKNGLELHLPMPTEEDE